MDGMYAAAAAQSAVIGI